jgi:hypothetical protein
MSTPFTVSAVGVRPLGGEGKLEVVGATVGDRLAGTLVVDAGHGEPLARLLRSAPVVEAARKAVAHHRGPGGLEDILGALDELAAALDAVDAPMPPDEMPIRPLEPVPPRALQHGLDPAQTIVEANNTLFFGNPEGKSGNSMWRATAVAGVVLVPSRGGPRPRPFGTFEGARNALECWPALSWQLRELADAIDGQLAAETLAERIVRGK